MDIISKELEPERRAEIVWRVSRCISRMPLRLETGRLDAEKKIKEEIYGGSGGG